MYISRGYKTENKQRLKRIDLFERKNKKFELFCSFSRQPALERMHNCPPVVSIHKCVFSLPWVRTPKCTFKYNQSKDFKGLICQDPPPHLDWIGLDMTCPKPNSTSSYSPYPSLILESQDIDIMQRQILSQIILNSIE